MPRGDGTGPNGMGSMTGRAAGYCAGFETPGFANPIAGRGRVTGFGGGRGGRGRRNMFYATGLPGWMRFGALPVSATEKQGLQEYAASLQQQLDALNKRIATLESAENKT